MRYIKPGEPCPYCAEIWIEDNIIENIKTNDPHIVICWYCKEKLYVEEEE